MMTSARQYEITAHRKAFVAHLYGLHAALDRDAHQASQARRQLALLRRSFAGPRQESDAYEIVFRHDPPVAEQRIWLIVAGLFALHPHARPAITDRPSLGAAMRALASRREALAERQLKQLLSVEPAALPHHLRRTMTLLKTEDVAVDFYQLLNDLLCLLPTSFTDPDAHQVRLQWARDFYRPDTSKNKTASKSATQGDR